MNLVTISKKVALVTGGANGIGKAIVCKMAMAGCEVVIADKDGQEAAALANTLCESGHSVTALTVDISSVPSLEEAFHWLDNTLGRCDILINNAGIAKTYPFISYPLDNWQLTLDVNLTGTLLITQKAALLMIKHQWGRIINMASAAGIRAGRGRTAYGTSKAALIGLTRQIAIEMAPYNITANSIAPGPIDTPMVSKLHSPATRDHYTSLVPMRRYGTPEEVAAVACFLASEEASYITGTTIPVDGGFIAAGLLEI